MDRNGKYIITFNSKSGIVFEKENKYPNNDPLNFTQILYNGQHGGATLDELLIPVIISSADKLNS